MNYLFRSLCNLLQSVGTFPDVGMVAWQSVGVFPDVGKVPGQSVGTFSDIENISYKV